MPVVGTRFKMDIGGSRRNTPAHLIPLPNITQSPPPQLNTTTPSSSLLNAPMIQRVYRAKSGCSSCGKRVA
jgi:hypothetical protein